MTADDVRADLRTVRLRSVPLPIQARSAQHFDEVMREFALISMDTDRTRLSSDSARPVPTRLLALVDELTGSYSSFTAAVEAELDEAVARGDSEIDLTYHLPESVVDAARQLGTLLDEVDDYCRAGRHLITLATAPDEVAFREWYLGEFVAQIKQGRDPMSWPEYVAEHHAEAEWATG